MRLGDQRTGNLLEPGAEALGVGAARVGHGGGQQVDHVAAAQVGGGLVRGGGHQRAVLVAHLRATEVGSVAREGDQQADDGLAHGLGAVFVTRLGQGALPKVDHQQQLGSQFLAQDLVLGLDHGGVEIGLQAGVARPGIQQRGVPLGIGQQARDVARGLVAGGALDRPVGQRLVAGQDLLDPDRAVVSHPGAQPFEVIIRIGEAVHVVDPQRVDQPAVEQVEDLGVAILKHRFVLDPHADQVGHGEEAPVRDAVAFAHPVRQPPGLAVVHLDHDAAGRPRRQRHLKRAVRAQHVAVDLQPPGLEHRLERIGQPG